MGNVLRILARDFGRLLKAPAALIVVIALLVLPSLYTWYNVVAFWNPYQATGGIRVCVVNQDAGTSNDTTGQLNVGDKLIEQLQENDQLTWVTDEDYDTAMEDLKAGNVYAVYVVPEDFSDCLVSPLTGEVKGPHIQYYANEKLGPVSPKVTDTVASTLERQINSTFVATVTEVATQAVDDAAKKAKVDIATAQTKTSSRANEAKSAVAEVRGTLSDVSGTIDESRTKVAAANDAISDTSKLVGDTQVVLQDVADEAGALQTTLAGLSLESAPELSDALAELSQVTAKTSTVADAVASSMGEAQAKVDMAAARIQPVIDAMRTTASDLEAMAASVTLPALKEKLLQAAQDVTARADELQATLDGATALAERAGNASRTAADTAKALNENATQVSNSIAQYSSDIHGSASSAVNADVAEVNAVCAQLSAAVSSLDAAVGQVRPVLGQLDGVLADCSSAISQTNALIGDVQTDLESVMLDANMLAKSDVIANLLEHGTLNSQGISEFMGSPTELSTTKFYHPNAYGTAMAPLFMNLTFWIGAFMLMIIFLLEVDSEGISGLKPWQRYLGRFSMFCIFAVLQAVICCAGTLALGVEAANVPALFGASAVSSLAFLSVIYALSSTFRHVGKAFCIILVFAQIPGASGLYPVEMTSRFFQAIFPFLPFTYGIDAMREAIGGFYGNYFVNDLLMLALFFFGSIAFGLIFGPSMSNVVRMTAQQLREGDLYNSEDVRTPERPYLLANALRVLSEREEYREDLEARYARFSRRYPVFIRVSIVLGVGVPVVIALLLTLDTADKALLLTLFLGWLIALIGFLVVVESQRYSIKRQLNLGDMSDAHLLRIFANRDRFAHVEAVPESSGAPVGAGGSGSAMTWQGRFSDLEAAARAKRASAGGVRNVFLIAHADLSGLFKNVMSVVITVGLVVLPSLFAWYNILACWNVFDNTSQLSIAVACEDEGYESDLLAANVNVGDKVLSALHENDQINWVFTDPDEAIEGVKAGRYYAALVIPKGFSKDMLTFYEGDSYSATINYYVNEKKNAIAPNITGMGADAVSHEVNTAFTNAMAEVALGIAQSLSRAAEAGDADGRIESLAKHMRTVADRLDQSANVLDMYSNLAKDSQNLVQSGADTVTSARKQMVAAAYDIDAGKQHLRGLVDNLTNSVSEVSEILNRAESAVAELEQRAEGLSGGASGEASIVESKLRDKASEIDGRIAQLNDVIAKLEKLRDELKSGAKTQMNTDISDGKANVEVVLPDGTTYQSGQALQEDIEALSNTIDALGDAKDALNQMILDDLISDKPTLQAKIAEIDAKIANLEAKKQALQELLDSRVDVDVDVDVHLSRETEVLLEDTIILDKDIAMLKKAVEILQKASSSCTDAADALQTGRADIENAARTLRDLVATAKADADVVKQDLENGLQPGADQLQSDVATLVYDLEQATDKLRALDPDLAGALEKGATALGEASSKITEASTKLRTASQKVRSLADAVDVARTSGDVGKLRSLMQDEVSDLAAALTSPVTIERTALFPSENFGSAMTPLYSTLALFIGALLIMVAMKPEVSQRGRAELHDPKPRHLFFGRFIAVAAVSLMQTTLMGLGNMLFLKVQVADPLLFMTGFWFSGLVLAFIIYTLVVSFGNLGKAIAVLLLIVQVTACGGSFPLQMLPDFVQAISPWVPATYIVDMLQSAMMGVYNNDFFVAMGKLALFIVPFLLLGLVLRKPMERFMKFYVRKVEECGIMA